MNELARHCEGVLAPHSANIGRKNVIARAALYLTASLSLTTVAASAATPNAWWEAYEYHSEHVRLPDGRQMNLFCEGSGSPTVILDSGLGGGAWDWRFVQEAIAKQTRVCSYDRAGIGGSDPGPMPRDTKAIVADLQSMLTAAKLRGPYVMVGHSLGSFDVRYFADRHRRAVAGMVLVDPSADNQNERLAAVIPDYGSLQSRADDRVRRCLTAAESKALKPGASDYRTCVGDPPLDMPQDLTHFHFDYMVDPVHYRTTLSELDSIPQDSIETTAAKRSFGAMPLIVLTADSPGRGPAASKVWNQMHDEIAALSTRGVNRQVPNSGHYIQSDAPQVVIEAVKEVVREARSAKPAA